jgi:glycosyltransferase involved in cell wall biosynthesis
VLALCRPAAIAKAWRLAHFLRRQRIDILHVYFPDSTYLGVLAGWLARVPHLVQSRNSINYWPTPLARWLGRCCNRLTDILIANCAACRQAARAEGGLRPEQLVILENGVDLARFPLPRCSPGPQAERRPRRVGVVANLRLVKGLEHFVQAAAEVSASQPAVSFHIAGEGELRPALQRLVTDLGLAERVCLPGLVADVPGFLHELDVAVLCSTSEGMSNALLEYMAAGRAIVATAVGGNTELIVDGVHGLLVPAGDPPRLAAAIRRLLLDGNLRTRLGAAARQRVEEHYSREAMVRRFEAFYDKLARHDAAASFGRCGPSSGRHGPAVAAATNGSHPADGSAGA